MSLNSDILTNTMLYSSNSRERRSVSSDAAASRATFNNNYPTFNNSRRSSRSQRTTTAASTPHSSDDDWPSAPNLFGVECENLRETEDALNHSLDLQLTQKTIAMLAMIRGTTPDRMRYLLDGDGQTQPYNSTTEDANNFDGHSDLEFNGLDDCDKDIDQLDTEHDYLVGEVYVDIDGDHVNDWDSRELDEDAEEDIFGMEI